ncbi:hypothetical protein ACHAWF_003795, partial [Thalassiosira exigua]
RALPLQRAIGIAAIRDGKASGPGDALDRLNREILSGENFFAPRNNESAAGENPDTKNDDDQLFATLIDDNPQSSYVGNLLAVALPLVLSLTLGVSYLAISSKSLLESGNPGAIEETLASSLPYLLSLPSLGLCLLFVATEFRWALPNSRAGPALAAPTSTDVKSASSLMYLGNGLAIAYVFAAYVAKIHPTITFNGLYLDLWPLQNGVNIALAAAVTRGLSPFLLPPEPSTSSSTVAMRSLRTCALALIGITLFDAVSVFGTVANAAASDESSMSVMETVARFKIASQPSEASSPLSFLWQPGLLSIILGHDNSRITEALGLGDVVFPSILVAWGFAADEDSHANNAGAGVDYPYTTATIIGYALGSFATEIVGSFSLLGNVSGLPALVFLVPSMLSVVTLMAWSRSELGDVWGFTGSSGGGVDK